MVTQTADKTAEWIETHTYRGRTIQRTYADDRQLFRVRTESGRWMKKRTLPDCQRFIDRMLD